MTAAVFDLGGVVVEWNPGRLFHSVLGDAEAVARFMAEVDFAAWNNTIDMGQPFGATVDALATDFPQWAAVIAAYRDRWEDAIGPVHPETIALVDELKDGGVACFVLSNSSTETVGRSRDVGEALTHFDGVLLSGEIGVCKPDPAIYAEAERRFDLVPTTTWFTDDNPANVDAAIAAGWRAQLCTDPAGLRAAAVGAGLLKR